MLTEKEFKEMQREHHKVYRDLCMLPPKQLAAELRAMFPKMYDEKGKLKQRWLDF